MDRLAARAVRDVVDFHRAGCAHVIPNRDDERRACERCTKTICGGRERLVLGRCDNERCEPLVSNQIARSHHGVGHLNLRPPFDANHLDVSVARAGASHRELAAGVFPPVAPERAEYEKINHGGQGNTHWSRRGAPLVVCHLCDRQRGCGRACGRVDPDENDQPVGVERQTRCVGLCP